MLDIDVVICTIDAGIERVPDVLAGEPTRGVKYVVSMQYTDESFLSMVPSVLKERADVFLYYLQGRGLSRNRNHALSKCTADIVLIADDDEILHPQAFERIRQVYAANPKVDIALFQFTDYAGQPMCKHYPRRPTPFAKALAQGYYPCSWELSMRVGVVEQGFQFDERFGLGADYLTSGEEDVFLHEAEQGNLQIVCYPAVIGATDADNTGKHLYTDVGVQRAKGAVFALRFGRVDAYWRCLREALHHFLLKGRNPVPLFIHFCQGISYVVHTHPNL